MSSYKLIIRILIFWAVILLSLVFFAGCKVKDVVTYTEDGWRMHSITPVDTTLR